MRSGAAADLVLLQHMRECIVNILSDTQLRREVFAGSRTIRDAVLRNLHTLTESGQRLSDACRSTEPGIPWRRMAGMRNILVHDYLGGLDLDMVWVVVERELPPLKEAIDRMIARESGGSRGET